MSKRQHADDVVMDRGRLSFTFVLVVTFGALLLFQPFVDGREFRREATCYNDVLHLDCGKSVIAVHEAYFTTAKSENHTTCHSPAPEHDYIEDNADAEIANESICHQDIRISLNRKCSGFKSCNYSYTQQPEKSCYNHEGLFVVRFDCVRESNVNKYCNSKILSPEGYIASPGYPQYYPELKSCSWTLSASEGQTILASILHLHIREAVDVTPTLTSELDFHVMGQLVEAVRRCDEDRLTIMEGMIRKLEVCGEDVEALGSVEVDGVAGLEVRFRSVAFLPASGFLVYFKIQGCPTLAAGDDSYLVERNGSAAVYACRNHQVFNDTLEGRRFLKCVRDHHWNDTLPPCTSLEDTTSTTLTTVSGMEEEFNNSTMAANEKMHTIVSHKAHLVEDIIIPAVIIIVLLIVNGIVLCVIFAIRRRQKPAEDEFQGLGEQPPPIVSEEQFEEESPPTSSKETESAPSSSKEIKSAPTSSKVTESAPSSLKETKSAPTTSKVTESPPKVTKKVTILSPQTSPIESESQPSGSQEAKGSC